ncbi:hypothetical protein Tco_1053970 [Tanacetum coccineum]|uniref:Reverse transcriptase domain-containing protein n=1 Tax=Tanacetum coccineum TaxID=301880 RepID=A0ABQ5GXV4_9ASTR
MTRQLIDSQGPIPNKTPNQALEAIQTMADHSQKWHDESNSRKVSSGSSDDIAAIANKLDSLGRDMKKLKENVHDIQVGCETCGGAYLNKECPLCEDVKSIKEVKYGKFGRSFPNNSGNGDRYRVGIPGYYTRVDNRPPFSEKMPNLKELMNKHLEESTQRRADMEDWMKKHQESTQYKAVFVDNEASRDETSYNGTNELHRVSFISDDNMQVFKKTNEWQSRVLPCQLPLKELSPRSFTLPYTIGSLNLYAMADLDMSKKAPMRTVEHVLNKIDKFVFLADFVIINMLGDPTETMILGRTFLSTIHARINVFHGEISLGIGEDRILFDINRNIHHPTDPVKKVYMANYVQEEE